jgi:outer membrane lipopolysaccharide assembly protein LptE/RlpB
MKALTTATLLAATLVLAACGDKAQTAGTPKSDSQPWDSAQTAYSAQGWKAGDKAAWENQLKARSQNQNEYSRAPAQP